MSSPTAALVAGLRPCLPLGVAPAHSPRVHCPARGSRAWAELHSRGGPSACGSSERGLGVLPWAHAEGRLPSQLQAGQPCTHGVSHVDSAGKERFSPRWQAHGQACTCLAARSSRVRVTEWLCTPVGGSPWQAAAPLKEQQTWWANKDIRGLLIKFADDTESLGRADALSDRIDMRHPFTAGAPCRKPGMEGDGRMERPLRVRSAARKPYGKAWLSRCMERVAWPGAQVWGTQPCSTSQEACPHLTGAWKVWRAVHRELTPRVW